MPITPLHLPFVLLFFLLVMLPLVASLIMVILPTSRIIGRRLLFGAVGSGCALVAYQLAYIPLLIISLAVSALIGWLMHGASFGQSVVAVVLLLGFYVFWFIALLCGYISGFRVGWYFGSGHSFSESLRSDYLSRLLMWGMRRVGRSKKDEHAA